MWSAASGRTGARGRARPRRRARTGRATAAPTPDRARPPRTRVRARRAARGSRRASRPSRCSSRRPARRRAASRRSPLPPTMIGGVGCCTEGRVVASARRRGGTCRRRCTVRRRAGRAAPRSPRAGAPGARRATASSCRCASYSGSYHPAPMPTSRRPPLIGRAWPATWPAPTPGATPRTGRACRAAGASPRRRGRAKRDDRIEHAVPIGRAAVLGDVEEEVVRQPQRVVPGAFGGLRVFDDARPSQRRLARRSSSRTAAAPVRCAPAALYRGRSRASPYPATVLECVPNVSEGRDRAVLDALAAACGVRPARPPRRRRPPPRGVHPGGRRPARSGAGAGARGRRPCRSPGPRRGASPLRRARRRAVRGPPRRTARTCGRRGTRLRVVDRGHARAPGVPVRPRRSAPTHPARRAPRRVHLTHPRSRAGASPPRARRGRRRCASTAGRDQLRAHVRRRGARPRHRRRCARTRRRSGRRARAGARARRPSTGRRCR